MPGPNESTRWADAEADEAVLDLKEPIADHDPNVGTRWAEPEDPKKPAQKVERDIDKALKTPVFKCPDCSFESYTQAGKISHMAVGGDGLTPCQRERKRFQDLEACDQCKGLGTIKGVECLKCTGTGKVRKSAMSEEKLAEKVAEKVAEAVGQEINKGFALLAAALQGGGASKVQDKKKVGRPRGSARSVPRKAEAGGPPALPPVEHPGEPVGDPAAEPEKS